MLRRHPDIQVDQRLRAELIRAGVLRPWDAVTPLRQHSLPVLRLDDAARESARRSIELADGSDAKRLGSSTDRRRRRARW